MLERPLIGISANPAEADNPKRDEEILRYCSAVADAGGVPLILPFLDDPSDYPRVLDGWLIAGGKDIDPVEYGQAPHEKTDTILRRRYDFETKLWPMFVATGKPILGICYGCQFMNVRYGGDLVQHIEDDHLRHEAIDAVPQPHEVALDEGSLAATACGNTRFESASSHHQALGKIGEGLRVTGRAPDGIVEAIEREGDQWMLGVQWHPEKLPDAGETKSVMRAFVDAAAKR